MSISYKNGEKKVVVVMPAFNAEKTLRNTYNDIPQEYVDEIILVDDASKDNTVELAKSLNLKVIEHKNNGGYGANQKTCYKEALKIDADIVIMIHPDHQYSPKYIPQLITPILDGKCDAVFGSRMLGGEFFEGGMPRWKFIANVFLTAIENIVLGMFLTECHSGLRAYSAKYLKTIKFQKNSNDFVFDTEIIVQGIHNKLKIYEIPIETRYFDDASQIGFGKSLKYGLSILLVMGKFMFHKHKLKKYSIL
ncbi:MAG: glycosyltransferase family 2 protein [Candidatus Margulisbacteria bacterium]|nr:glycosyltransferase family 2 protein [Candidatus Margulisiibacteriota bacterium]